LSLRKKISSAIFIFILLLAIAPLQVEAVSQDGVQEKVGNYRNYPKHPDKESIQLKAEPLREMLRAEKQAAHKRELRRKKAAAEAAAAEAAAEAAASTPTPSTSNYSSYTGGVLTAEQVASYARSAGFPEYIIPTMVSIAYRESRFNPGAVNSSSGACGLWQLYPCPGAWALTPSGNAAGAYEKYKAAGGLSPWGG